MTSKGLDPVAIGAAFENNKQNARMTCRQLDISIGTLYYHLRRLPGFQKPEFKGTVRGTINSKRALPKKGEVTRYILTSAQNNTKAHPKLWDNMLALADHFNAELIVSTFTYAKRMHGATQKRGSEQAFWDAHEYWYDEQLLPFLNDQRIELAPGLVFFGDMNVLPTAADPLQGMQSFGGRVSAIIPHAKISMRSVPTAKNEPVKLMYTTGACTMLNYLQKRAGQIAEFHHAYGALLVEVASDGAWWVRQLNADKKWRIFDLDVYADRGTVFENDNGVEAINWGDIHYDQMNHEISSACWDEGGMLDTLKPNYQFMHDVLDFRSRNHHESKNPHLLYKKYVQNKDKVEDEVRRVSGFLELTRRDWCQTVVVNSNHDRAMERWLREADFRWDPPNAPFFLRAQAAIYESITEGNDNFDLLEWACRHVGRAEHVRFLRKDETFIICKDSAGGIECGQHGDLGANGGKGNARGYSRMGGRKLNRGHDHTASIVDGIYTAGVTANLDQGFNAGFSSWSHTHTITYPNGKRCQITMQPDGRWRA